MKMENHQFPGSRGSPCSWRYRAPGAVSREDDPEGWCRLTGGRIAAVAAVLAFIACYGYGIAAYGLLLGIALGWLPAGVAAWLAAIMVAPLATTGLRFAIVGSRYLSSRVHAILLHR